MRIVFVYILFSIISFNTYAFDIGSSTGLKIPRFVSLKSNEVNLRVGPSANYPIELKYIRNNLPIEIIDEYDLWRKITDIDGNIGWVHKGLIKGERYAIIVPNNNKKVFVLSNPIGRKIGEIGKNNIVKLNNCLKQWCYIYALNNKGWVNKKDLWGVYDNEIYKMSFMQPIKTLYWKCLKIIYNINI